MEGIRSDKKTFIKGYMKSIKSLLSRRSQFMKRSTSKSLLLEYSDLARIWSIKKMRLAMLGVLALPLVYSFIYLWAFYDPYENVKYLPVAVVNEDQGVHDSKHDLEAGDKLVDKLKSNSKVKWEFVTASQMEKGFDEGKYALGVVIPSDFSQKVITVDSPEPLRNTLEYHYDASTNYLSTRIGNSVIQSLKTDLGNELTKGFLEEIFKGLDESTAKLEEAADGASKLKDGSEEAQNKSGLIADKTGQLKNGADQVHQGNKQMETKLVEFRNGINQISDAIDQLQNGSEQIDSQLQPKITKVKQVQKKIHQINDEIQKIANQPVKFDSTTLKNQIDKLQVKIDETKKQNAEAKAHLESLIAKNPDLANDPATQQLKESLSVIGSEQQSADQKLGNLSPEEIQKEITQLTEWKRGFAEAAQSITNTVDQQVESIVALGDGINKINGGLEKVQKGQDKLETGANLLVEGAGKLDTGSGLVASNLELLQDGQEKLTNGLGKIADGSGKLEDGLKDGVEKAKDSLVAKDQKEDVMSNPVDVKEKELHPVPNYATGFAPYFISLSLWVGAMILFTIFDLFHLSDKIPNRPVRLPLISMIGIIQAVITSAALTLGLGIDVQLPGWLYLFTILMAVTFISINQLLVTYFGNVGRFLAIVILMFQLASSGGTYPVELTPSLIQSIHPYLPMSYSVHGLRAILSSGNATVAYEDSIYLLIYFLVSVTLTQIGARYVMPYLKEKLKRKNKEDVAIA